MIEQGSRGWIKTVQILQNLLGPHSQNLAKAMDRTSQRHSLLTKNLANANVTGYKREDIDFAIEIEDREGSSRLEEVRSRLAGNHRSTKGSVRIDGSSVDLEKEVMAIAESELRYQMLTEMTSRYFSGLKSVIREGR